MSSLALALAVMSTAIGGGTYEGQVDAPCDHTCRVRISGCGPST